MCVSFIMDFKTFLYWILAAALIWFLLNTFLGRSTYSSSMYGGMDPGVFDQLASNSGPEDAYLIYPEYDYGYDYLY